MARKAWPPSIFSSAFSNFTRSRWRMSPWKARHEESVRAGVSVSAWPFTSSTSFSNSACEPVFTPRVRSRCTPASVETDAAARASGAVVCQNAFRSGMEYRVVTTHRPRLVAASPLSSAAMPWSLSSPGVGEVGAYCSGSRPSRMSRPAARRRAGQPPAFVERAGALPASCRVAEEGEGFLEKQVGGSGGLLARALAVEGPREGGVAPRPVLMRQLRRPLGHERGFPFAAEGDEGEDVGALWLARARPWSQASVRSLVSASRPMSSVRGVFDDAGDVGLEDHG